MAEDSEVQERPCCAKRKERFLKLKENRDFLRNALHSVTPTMIQLEDDNLKLKKAYEAEQARAEAEKEAKEKESAARADLEKEVLDLKSEISLLRQNSVSGDQDNVGEEILLQIRISELEGEINQLKEILEEERQKVDLQKKIAELEKKKAEEECKVERDARLDESFIRDALEKEILNLKSVIAVLKEIEGPIDRDEDGEVVQLRTRVSEGEAEISRLSELLDKERKNGDNQLKEILEEERQKVDLQKKIAELEKKEAEEECKVERDARLDESFIRDALEKEILNLKSEIAVLKEIEGPIDCDEDGEVVQLRTRVSEGEAEISRLSELLDKERKNGDLEKQKVQAEKKEVEEAWKIEAEARSIESSVRAGLENEILDLKSEIALLREEKASKILDEGAEILLQTRISQAEEESSQLKKLLDQERKKIEAEQKKSKAEKKKAKTRKLEIEAKLKESAGLENEILKLKAEIASLKEKMGSRDKDECSEILLLQSRVSKGEAEIHRLNELCKKERIRGDSEKKRAEVEKKKASEVWKILKSEKNKVEEERRVADIQRRCAEECRRSLEASRADANELRAKLVLESSRIEEAHRKLEAENQMSIREKKYTESEMAKVEVQKLDEKNHADNLSQKLEEARQRIESLEKEIQEILSTKKTRRTFPATSDVSRNLMLLEKQLKIEKCHVKHAKKVAKFEKLRNSLLAQELYHLKQDLFHFCYRLNALDGSFSHGIEGIDASPKIKDSFKPQSTNGNDKFPGKEPFSLYGKSENEHVKARYTSMDCFDRFRSTVECSASLSDGSGSSTKTISGISSTLESLIEGSLRNQLQNSAIYSNSASFSDRPSVGSQENNIFSVTRPDNLMKQGPIVPRLSAESTKLRINENLGVVTENSVRTMVHRDLENPCLSLKEHDGIKAVGGDPGSKRKRFPDEVASIECLGTELKNFNHQIKEKLTAVNGELILESDMPKAMCSEIDGKLSVLGNRRCRTPLLLDDAHNRKYRPNKKGKVSLEQKHILEPGSKGVNRTHNVETVVTKYSGVSGRTNPPRDEPVDTLKINQETEVSLEKMTGEEIMKMLELDDPDDEERFRMALERPLSPTLPEIEIGNMEALEVDDSIVLKEGIYSGTVNEIDKAASSCHIDVEKDFNQLKGYDWTMQEPQNEDAVVDITTDVGNMFPFQFSMTNTVMDVPTQLSKNEVMEVSYTNSAEHRHETVPKYFVAFPNIKDKSSISRIISACETCIFNTSKVSQNVWMVEKILDALTKEEDLRPEEKACVFFSLLVHNFLVVTSLNFKSFFSEDMHSCSDSLLAHMKTVMSDAGTRNNLQELLQLDTLLILIESFLIDKRVMVYTNLSYQPHSQCDSQSITLLDGTSVLLFSETARTDSLVAGSFILASICATTGHIGFICEASYKFLRMQRSDTYLMLTVLHVFASFCGSKYISSNSHSLIMTVIRSIVTCLERETLSTDAVGATDTQYGSARPPKFRPCAQCMFSEGVDSVDEVLSLLLEKLQDYAVKMDGYQPDTDGSDILSLVELLGYYTSWDWTWSKVIPQLLTMVKSCVSEKVSVAILFLIGQLGRFGTGDSGSASGMEELRCSLANILNQKATSNYSLPKQFAIVHALIGLFSVNFGDLVKNEKLPADGSQHVHANFVRAWFNELNEEQKSLFMQLEK